MKMSTGIIYRGNDGQLKHNTGQIVFVYYMAHIDTPTLTLLNNLILKKSTLLFTLHVQCFNILNIILIF